MCHNGKISRDTPEIPLTATKTCCSQVNKQINTTPGPWPTRLLCPWDSPGKNTGHCIPLLQGNLPDPGTERVSLVSLAVAGRFFTSQASEEAKTRFISFFLNVGGCFLVATSIRDVNQCLLGRTSDILQCAILYSKNCSKSPMTSACAIRYSCRWKRGLFLFIIFKIL